MEPSTGIDPAVKNMDEGVLTYSPLGISQIALSATLYIARRQQGLLSCKVVYKRIYV